MSFQKLYGAQLNGAQEYKKTDFLNFGTMVAEISVKDAKKKIRQRDLLVLTEQMMHRLVKSAKQKQGRFHKNQQS